MKLFTAFVLDNEEIMRATNVLTLRAGQVARSASPGQFLHIRCDDGCAPFLRRPMSVYRTERDTIQLMIRDVGAGSARLVRARSGDPLDCLGPLGRGFHLDSHARNVLMVGGGYGVAPLVGLAERAVHQGMSVTLAVGAASAELIFPPSLLPEEVEYLVATDDGSAGHRGYVTDLVGERLAWADAVYACGPLPMMAALARVVRDAAPRKRVQVAMEERMGCAMGVCLGCVIETTRGPLRVCTEGPVFDIRQIVWRDEPAALGTGG
ncbi:MAG: dihydroorotate dehydrogenase electron transfer subunit [Chloroflexi bacterium]|nr:dihydroorotate dehydrogenase electron transfer subunit [Chloroflexota bacterium]